MQVAQAPGGVPTKDQSVYDALLRAVKGLDETAAIVTDIEDRTTFVDRAPTSGGIDGPMPLRALAANIAERAEALHGRIAEIARVLGGGR